MNVTGKKLTIETMTEALDIWSVPQYADYLGGGVMSLKYAVYDYCGVDIFDKEDVDGYRLVGANSKIQKFYDTLCENTRLYATNNFEYNLKTGKHNFPNDCAMLAVLEEYRKNKANFNLRYISSDDTILMLIENLTNGKSLEISIIGDIYDHSAFWIFWHEFQFEGDDKCSAVIDRNKEIMDFIG